LLAWNKNEILLLEIIKKEIFSNLKKKFIRDKKCLKQFKKNSHGFSKELKAKNKKRKIKSEK
jgi:hypothetical protein